SKESHSTDINEELVDNLQPKKKTKILKIDLFSNNDDIFAQASKSSSSQPMTRTSKSSSSQPIIQVPKSSSSQPTTQLMAKKYQQCPFLW
ncbi:2686_t:CDS:2, partial [Funneliformis caledonium]